MLTSLHKYCTLKPAIGKKLGGKLSFVFSVTLEHCFRPGEPKMTESLCPLPGTGYTQFRIKPSNNQFGCEQCKWGRKKTVIYCFLMVMSLTASPLDEMWNYRLAGREAVSFPCWLALAPEQGLPSLWGGWFKFKPDSGHQSICRSQPPKFCQPSIRLYCHSQPRLE